MGYLKRSFWSVEVINFADHAVCRKVDKGNHVADANAMHRRNKLAVIVEQSYAVVAVSSSIARRPETNHSLTESLSADVTEFAV